MNDTILHTYNTFPQNVNVVEINIICPNGSCDIRRYIKSFTITLLILCLISNICGFIVGVKYNMADCYKDKYIMPLTSWLIMMSLFVIINALIYGVYSGFINYCIHNGVDETECCEIIIWLICVLIQIIIIGLCGITMIVIGMIELSYQYTSCNKEVSPVTIMTIIIIILNWFSYILGLVVLITTKL